MTTRNSNIRLIVLTLKQYAIQLVCNSTTGGPI